MSEPKGMAVVVRGAFGREAQPIHDDTARGKAGKKDAYPALPLFLPPAVAFQQLKINHSQGKRARDAVRKDGGWIRAGGGGWGGGR